MSTFKAFLRNHSGHLVAGASAIIATGVGTGTIIWDNRVGRNHTVNDLDAKINGIDAKIDSVRADINRVEKKLENCQWAILETGHYTMNALDGNKRSMREWLQRLERCMQSGGVDCGSVPKA
ncbi:hypothetical protein L873DRAFT_1800303 [Choiromyces venosus 120613-1]|uniref:Fungal N-terminal domain-containing protein n=1 Tax=Choiromyces venosus 120613-1 TaxID=1336337 RepID=A0A3N4K0E8_9PEZI|nr:hypothetical protein L873DRAFT_1800303 [Choiromyces venosus 120613-1]